ncbi:MAG: UDP-N-acetylmuramoyl-tripeptide--D-alanyl-D-alanine ligase [Nitrospirae bacterium]|nr:MAG: UDP-N-acetylmuramoyl-tripeptide--D-alanyl-D-alanine ligase [Nitrospirota bacterium]
MSLLLQAAECSDQESDDAVPLFTTGEIMTITGGVLAQGLPPMTIRRIWTDSRTVRSGDLFVALAGVRFDGHQFVADALKKGAAGAIVRRGFVGAEGARVPVAPSNATGDGPHPARKAPWQGLLIEVEDPLRAFQELARAHRHRFDIPVVAVSGSNGKTTTKEMIGAILTERFPTLKTDGNLNNHIGVPRTLLRLTARHRAAVIEMGISRQGEMTRLCEIAEPTHGVLTNIGPTHLETLGDLRTVAQAKGEMLDRLPRDGTAVLNADDVFFKDLAARVRGQVRSFGFSGRADVRALQVERRGPACSRMRVGVRGRARPLFVTLGVAGAHNLANALAAIATGLALGVGERAIRAGLARFRPSAMRSEVRRWRGVTWLNDCYNANPSSLRAALRWLTELKSELKGDGRAIAVLGDMLELGEGSVRIHRDIGEELARQGTDYLLTVGELAAEIAAGARRAGMPDDRMIVTQEHAALAERLQGILREGDVVLLKGSRGARMERVLEELA